MSQVRNVAFLAIVGIIQAQGIQYGGIPYGGIARRQDTSSTTSGLPADVASATPTTASPVASSTTSPEAASSTTTPEAPSSTTTPEQTSTTSESSTMTTTLSTTMSTSASCTGCNVCATGLKLQWVPVDFFTTAVVQVYEEIDPDTGKTSTLTKIADVDSAQFDLLNLKLSSQATTNSEIDNIGFIAVYPTEYLVYQPSYVYEGQFLTDGTCSQISATTAQAPVRTTAIAGAPSVIVSGVTDTYGLYYRLSGMEVDAPTAAADDDPILKSCKSTCSYTGYGTVEAANTQTYNIVNPTPLLSVAFVTTCSRSTKGSGVTEECKQVDAAAPDPGKNTAGGDSGTGDKTAGGGGGGGGGSDTPATAGNGGGGGGEPVTTTDKAGNPVVVAAPPASGNGGGGGSPVTTTDKAGNPVTVTAPAPAAGNLHATTNAQGATVIATGAAGGNNAVAGGQITVTNAAGQTIVVQGASLVPTGQAAANGDALTVTNELGELVVVQGGVTGTLTTGADGKQVLVVETVTQTGWSSGATIQATAAGEAEPTGVQSGARGGWRRWGRGTGAAAGGEGLWVMGGALMGGLVWCLMLL